MGEKDPPWRNQHVGMAEDCTTLEQMVQMGLLRQYHQVAGIRAYGVTVIPVTKDEDQPSRKTRQWVRRRAEAPNG
jgi:hypothetical protein